MKYVRLLIHNVKYKTKQFFRFVLYCFHVMLSSFGCGRQVNKGIKRNEIKGSQTYVKYDKVGSFIRKWWNEPIYAQTIKGRIYMIINLLCYALMTILLLGLKLARY